MSSIINIKKNGNIKNRTRSRNMRIEKKVTLAKGQNLKRKRTLQRLNEEEKREKDGLSNIQNRKE